MSQSESTPNTPFLNRLPRNPLGSSSVTSVYSADGGQGNYSVEGCVLLEIEYKYEVIRIRVIEAENLVGAKNGGFSDPYVKTCLLPDPSNLTKQRTNVKSRTKNPIYNEILKYHVSCNDIANRTIVLSVWDWDMLGRNLFLGQIRLPLISLDLGNTIEQWYPLNSRLNEPHHEDTGKIYFSIMYDETKECLYVKIINGMEIFRVDHKKYENCFVRLILLPDQSASSKRKTKFIKNSSEPVWKEHFSYDGVTAEDLKKRRVLELSLWNIDHNGVYNFIGCIRIGPAPNKSNHICHDWMDSNVPESCCWIEMLENPGKWTKIQQTLRPFIGSRFATHLNKWSESKPTDVRDCSACINKVKQKGDFTISGKLLVGLDYCREILYVHIFRVQKLAQAKQNEFFNTYLKVSLWRNKVELSNWRSPLKAGTCNPYFNETLQYEMKETQLSSYSLKFSAWLMDELSESKFLGETEVKLSRFIIPASPQWYNFVDDCDAAVEALSEAGKLSVGLKFVANNCIDGIVFGTLIVHVKNANELPKTEDPEDCSITVKLLLFPVTQSGLHRDTQQTKDVNGGLNPTWNEELKFDHITHEQLSSTYILEITVWKKFFDKNTVLIGGLCIGSASHIEKWTDPSVLETEHWEELIQNSSVFIERCHTLRPSMQYTCVPVTTEVVESSSEQSSSTFSLSSQEPSISFTPKKHAIIFNPQELCTTINNPNLNQENFIGQATILVMFKIDNDKPNITGSLHVKIEPVEVLNYPTSNIKVKCLILPQSRSSNPKIIKCKETSEWDNIHVFQSQSLDELLFKRVLDITLWDNSFQSKHIHVLIGRVRLGPEPLSSTARIPEMDSNKKEVQHWQAVFKHPGEWIKVLHNLR